MKENLDEVIDAVKEWLSLPKNTRRLAIYDNYDNPKLPDKTDPTVLDIQQFLPESYQGSIIITTRSSQVTIGHQIQIRKLENEKDSLKILLNTSRREGLINGKDLRDFEFISNLNNRSRRNKGCEEVGRTSTCASYSWSISQTGGNELLSLSSSI
jgi:hypothetical protein